MIATQARYFERQPGGCPVQHIAGFTLVEVVITLAICGITLAGIMGGYTFCVFAAEKSALSLAANNRALQRVEETRAARWDVSSYPAVDEVLATNFPDQVVLLDLAGSGPGMTFATNKTSISLISATPPLKRVRVDCIWQFNGKRLMTNTIETCRSPIE